MSEGMIVGIDGGGSKTLVAAADRSGQVTTLLRGRATSPLESDSWQADLAAQVRMFATDPAVAAVAAALPAHGEVEEVSEAQRGVIAELFGTRPQRVLNDVDAAHIGAFTGGAGILILAGTGSMAWARDGVGTSYRTGGWGEIIGDEGSGYWIGKRVLEAVSKSIDGRGQATGMVDGVFRLLELGTGDRVNELEGWASRLENHRTQIAALAPVATTLAAEGDPAARQIIAGAAEELARHVRTLEERLDAPTAGWSYAGGMLSSAVLLEALTEKVGRLPQPPRLPPIGGALLAAAHQLGWQTDDAWIDRLGRSISTTPARTQ